MVVSRQSAALGLTFSNTVAVQEERRGTWIYVSGQVGWDDEGNVVSGGIEPETRKTFQHVARAVSGAGGSVTHIIKLTAYLTSLSDYPTYNTLRGEFFSDALPASTAVGVADLLFGACVEVDAIAFIPNE
jgi:enamine deaminase RidA (YjgF/YER057c/UK114 family)